MKKLFLFLITLSMVLTGCNFFCDSDTVSITAVYNKEMLTVSPEKTVVSRGKRVNITFSAKKDFAITEILLNGNSIELPEGNVLIIMNPQEDYVVEFITEKVVTYTIETLTDFGTSISPSGIFNVKVGTAKMFDFVANDGYYIDSLYVDGVGRKFSYATTVAMYNFLSNDTLHHTMRVVSRKRGKATIVVTSSSDGKISPSGTLSVWENTKNVFSLTPDELCEVKSLTVDGKNIEVKENPYSLNIGDTLNHTIHVEFAKEPEWYLCKITWHRDSLYFDNRIYYDPESEILNFSSDGKYSRFWNQDTDIYSWSLNKTVNPMVLTCGCGRCTIGVLNDKKFVMTYFDGQGTKCTTVYHGVPE